MLIISELNPFTCVAVWYLPSSGFIRFVTSTDALSVTGCWFRFAGTGL
jgi:hypothetical protein